MDIISSNFFPAPISTGQRYMAHALGCLETLIDGMNIIPGTKENQRLISDAIKLLKEIDYDRLHV